MLFYREEKKTVFFLCASTLYAKMLHIKGYGSMKLRDQVNVRYKVMTNVIHETFEVKPELTDAMLTIFDPL